jgi:hypothetical protein
MKTLLKEESTYFDDELRWIANRDLPKRLFFERGEPMKLFVFQNKQNKQWKKAIKAIIQVNKLALTFFFFFFFFFFLEVFFFLSVVLFLTSCVHVLFQECGGKALGSVVQCDVAIGFGGAGEYKQSKTKKVVLSHHWVLHCVMQAELLPMGPYVISVRKGVAVAPSLTGANKRERGDNEEIEGGGAGEGEVEDDKIEQLGELRGEQSGGGKDDDGRAADKAAADQEGSIVNGEKKLSSVKRRRRTMANKEDYVNGQQQEEEDEDGEEGGVDDMDLDEGELDEKELDRSGLLFQAKLMEQLGASASKSRVMSVRLMEKRESEGSPSPVQALPAGVSGSPSPSPSAFVRRNIILSAEKTPSPYNVSITPQNVSHVSGSSGSGSSGSFSNFDVTTFGASNGDANGSLAFVADDDGDHEFEVPSNNNNNNSHSGFVNGFHNSSSNNFVVPGVPGSANGGLVPNGVVKVGSQAQRKMMLQRQLGDLAREAGVSRTIALHALVVHSGDVLKARNYLFGVATSTRPWTVEEDNLIRNAHGPATVECLLKLLKTRTREEIVMRCSWLVSDARKN